VQIIERESNDGTALYDKDDQSAPLAVREDQKRSKMLLWSSPLGVGEALKAFMPIVANADPKEPTELTFFSGNGFSRRATDEVPKWLEKLCSAPEAVSRLRIECFIPNIGTVALEFNRQIPGMRLAKSAVSVTAPSIDHACLQKLYERSAVPEIAASFPSIAG
jgi:hypothetical protein